MFHPQLKKWLQYFLVEDQRHYGVGEKVGFLCGMERKAFREQLIPFHQILATPFILLSEKDPLPPK